MSGSRWLTARRRILAALREAPVPEPRRAPSRAWLASYSARRAAHSSRRTPPGVAAAIGWATASRGKAATPTTSRQRSARRPAKCGAGRAARDVPRQAVRGAPPVAPWRTARRLAWRTACRQAWRAAYRRAWAVAPVT
uniref:Uncharacterized protein n=1 Tax=Arundo donax TaxID=35708 RepID=A0A0A9G9V7_ARUDO